MSAIRTAVIQHRLALYSILAEKGGICKLLNSSCCFYVPDEYENISNIIEHMQDAIQPPPVATDSWFSWLQSWSQGWLSWLLTIITPVIVVFLLFPTLIPCLLKCLSNMFTKKTTQSSIYVHTNFNTDEQNSVSHHTSHPHHSHHSLNFNFL